jgi:hypothetical protein
MQSHEIEETLLGNPRGVISAWAAIEKRRNCYKYQGRIVENVTTLGE